MNSLSPTIPDSAYKSLMEFLLYDCGTLLETHTEGRDVRLSALAALRALVSEEGDSEVWARRVNQKSVEVWASARPARLGRYAMPSALAAVRS